MELKKNIAIATWYGPANYGTGLQALALSHFLKQNNYNVCFIEDCRTRNINEQNEQKEN